MSSTRAIGKLRERVPLVRYAGMKPGQLTIVVFLIAMASILSTVIASRLWATLALIASLAQASEAVGGPSDPLQDLILFLVRDIVLDPGVLAQLRGVPRAPQLGD